MKRLSTVSIRGKLHFHHFSHHALNFINENDVESLWSLHCSKFSRRLYQFIKIRRKFIKKQKTKWKQQENYVFDVHEEQERERAFRENFQYSGKRNRLDKKKVA